MTEERKKLTVLDLALKKKAGEKVVMASIYGMKPEEEAELARLLSARKR